MGGYGSGRQGGGGCTDDYRTLDVRRWQRDGLLMPGQSFRWTWYRGRKVRSSIEVQTEAGSVILKYQRQNVGSEWQPMEYPVRLNWTACHYGGERAWFICPAQGCGRRVALLYIGGAGIFACRHCYRLAYSCQRETDEDRILRKADKIRARLGWKPGVLNGHEWKPKGMRWRTYWQLVAEHDALVSNGLGMTARRFGIRV